MIFLYKNVSVAAMGFFQAFVGVQATYRQKGNCIYYCRESQGSCLEAAKAGGRAGQRGREGPHYVPVD